MTNDQKAFRAYYEGMPYDHELERNVLGSIIIPENDSLNDTAISALSPDDFTKYEHRLVMRCIRDIVSAGGVPSIAVISSKLGDSGKDIGGIGFFASLCDLITPWALEQNIVRIKELTSLRNAVRLSLDFLDKATGGESTKESLHSFSAGVERVLLQSVAASEGFAPLSEVIPEYLTEKDRIISKETTHVISSGYRELDTMMGEGFWESDLIIVAGRTRMGKTSLALDFAYAAALQGVHIAFLTMEMNRHQLLDRLVSKITGIDSRKIRGMNIGGADLKLFQEEAIRVASLPIHLDDSRGLTYKEATVRIKNLAAKLKNEGKRLGMVIADQASFLEVPHFRSDRRLAVGEITREGKKVAKDLGIPYILLNQIRRPLGKDASELDRPELAHMAESGSVENDADIVLAVWRPNIEDRVARNPAGLYMEDAFIVVLKQRNGPADMDIPVYFSRTQATFLDKGV